MAQFIPLTTCDLLTDLTSSTALPDPWQKSVQLRLTSCFIYFFFGSFCPAKFDHSDWAIISGIFSAWWRSADAFPWYRRCCYTSSYTITARINSSRRKNGCQIWARSSALARLNVRLRLRRCSVWRPVQMRKMLMRLGSRGEIANALSFVSCGPPALPSTCAAYRRFVEPWAKQGYLRRRRAAYEESCWHWSADASRVDTAGDQYRSLAADTAKVGAFTCCCMFICLFSWFLIFARDLRVQEI